MRDVSYAICVLRVVCCVCAVGIVYDKASHQQRFFLGHDDDILCLAMAPDRRTVATGQFGKDPHVLVWDSVNLTQLQRLQHG
jgi:WD40 repeat protein